MHGGVCACLGGCGVRVGVCATVRLRAAPWGGLGRPLCGAVVCLCVCGRVRMHARAEAVRRPRESSSVVWRWAPAMWGLWCGVVCVCVCVVGCVCAEAVRRPCVR